MIGDDQREAAVEMRPSPKTADRLSGSQERLSGERAERHEHLRVDQVDLLEEKRRAGGDLLRLRIPVSGRSTLEHVADVDLVPSQAHRHQHEVQQLAGTPDEGSTGLVLDRARRFTDTDETSVRGPLAEDHVLPALVQRTALAGERHFPELIEVQLADPLGGALSGEPSQLRSGGRRSFRCGRRGLLLRWGALDISAALGKGFQCLAARDAR